MQRFCCVFSHQVVECSNLVFESKANVVDVEKRRILFFELLPYKAGEACAKKKQAAALEKADW